MSDQQLTDPQAPKKHAGGRPKKPKPAPPLPPPAPYSLEETLLMGDQAAAKGTPAAQLRWVPQRALLLKENQARKDADRHNALETDNKRLRESVEALERAKQKLENELKNKDRDLAEARSESDKMATKLKEMTDEHAHLLGGLTNKMRATEENAKGLLAIVRCVCSQWKNHPGGERVEFAARLMHFSQKARKEASRLGELMENPEAHRRRHAARYETLRPGCIQQNLNSLEFAALLASQEQAIERYMREDRERFSFEFSNIISAQLMNQAFELLSVTREEVVRHLDTEREERKD